MTASAISGRQFAGQEQVTQDKCYDIVRLMTIMNLGGSETASDATIYYVSSSAPTTTKYVWVDTNLGLLRHYDGTDWQPSNGIVLTNNSGGALAAGDVVVTDITADASFTTTTTADFGRVLGVLAHAVSNGDKAVVQLSGYCTVNLNASYGNGQFYLATSTTAGKGKARSTIAANTIGTLLDANSTTGNLVKCNLYGQPVL